MKLVSWFRSWASVVRDNNTYVVKDMLFIEDIANNNTPPSLDHLILLHKVIPEKQDDQCYWFHTH
jgi:hypothetical protein